MKYFTKEKNIMIDLNEVIGYCVSKRTDNRKEIELQLRSGAEVRYYGNIASEIPKILQMMGKNNLKPLNDINLSD